MKIALIGATGNVGSAILVEARRRGHLVTALARRIRPGQFLDGGVTAVSADFALGQAFVDTLVGHDAVISAMKFKGVNPNELLAVVKSAKVPRLLVVGGAGSLEITTGGALVDTPGFPPEYKEEALAGRSFLETLRTERTLDWTFLSPSAFLAPGERTGKFRLGEDRLLVSANGESRISVGDYAQAMIDELETPLHSRRRFTVGY
jgi:uncharacterized protein